MVMPSLFPPGREPLVNYDWEDVDSATGYVLYDGWGSKPSTGDIYSLTPSNEIDELISSSTNGVILRKTSANSTSSTFVELLDLNFDTTEFQLPRNVKGNTIIRVPIWLLEVAAGSGYSLYIIAKLRKYSVATGEVEIASIQSYTDLQNASKQFGFSLIIPTPFTHFKKGEQIRLTIGVWAKNTNGTDEFNVSTAFNPNDTVFVDAPAFSAGNTRLVIAIPFKTQN